MDQNKNLDNYEGLDFIEINIWFPKNGKKKNLKKNVY